MKRSRFTRACSALLLATLVLLPLESALAADPASGSIAPSVGATVTWDGFSPLGAAASNGESTCIEGTNCDTFTLTVDGNPEDWVGKLIEVKIEWVLGTNDYDLYIHKDSNSGAEIDRSGDAPPVTEEAAAIQPASTGTGTYTVHVVYFAVAAGDPYVGTATVTALQEGRTATYLDGGITFAPNVALKAPVTRRDGEPSCRVDLHGNTYVAGIRGVPAGTDLWFLDLNPNSVDYDPWMRNPIYRGQPDEFLIDEGNAASVGADGGGDIDLAVGFGDFNGGPPFLAAVSLVAANISATHSPDRGETFILNPVGSEHPVDDRQWIEAYGDSTVYLYYRTISVPVFHYVQRSDDGGLTYGPPVLVGLNGQTGYIDVDQSDGTVYLSRQSGGTVTVAVGEPLDPSLPPATYTDHVAVEDPSSANNIFAPIKVADDGTVYVTYSNGSQIYLTHSSDRGETWAPAVRVSNGPDTRTSLMPWLETGQQPGSVAVVWYGTDSPTNSDDADWHVFFAQSFDADTSNPTFRQVKASDHVIHASNISTGGLLGAANRNLIDYFQVAIDPLGAAVICYTDDHNDYDGHTYVTRQIGGLSFNDKQPLPDPGPAPAPAPAPADGSQVVDFRQDQVIGLLGSAPVDSPFDVLGVRYSCEDGAEGKQLVATMAVSELAAVPPAGNWRVNFTANAPDSVMSPTGEFTFAVSDRGDQFFLRASTETNPAGTFTYGTAVRNSDGSLSYTTRGNANGEFDTEAGTITMKVGLDALNPFVAQGPTLAAGSVLAGLRGQAFTSGVNAVTDIARGGLLYTVADDCSAEGPVCGNGVVEVGEACDDGNTTDGDGCDASCRIEACGNGRVDAGEECDDGNTSDGDGCSSACVVEFAACGNGVVESGEECDDGNTDDGDGCSSACTIETAECGNGIVESGEECDGAAGACPSECRSDCTCPVDGSIHKVTGGGRILGKTVNFGFNAKDDLSGHVNYKDREDDFHLTSTRIVSFVVTGENEVTFSGTGEIDGTPVTFEITVVDNGEPGSNDYFRIEIAGGYSRSGTLTQGNVQVHR